MQVSSQNQRIIFGLKVRQLRQAQALSSSELAKSAGLSLSYLNEIEKGKKFPKPEKLETLAKALGTTSKELSSPHLKNNLAPVGKLLRSNFLNELPLDLFGIELAKVAELIANAPARVGAFISTLIELSRTYALGEETFYHAALRSFQEVYHNYFEDIEEAVQDFVEQHPKPNAPAVSSDYLEACLVETYGYEIDRTHLGTIPALEKLQFAYFPEERKLLLNPMLSPVQSTFILARELGYQALQLEERFYSAAGTQDPTFNEVLNKHRASYFANALLVDKDQLAQDLEQFFKMKHWDGEFFLGLMKKYQASPEMFFQRLTNILPRYFDLPDLFFTRCVHYAPQDTFRMEKELHLNRTHRIHRSRLSEHYCRRWMSISLLKDLGEMLNSGKYAGTIVGVQRSNFYQTDDEYLIFTLARPAHPTSGKNVSVTIGLLLSDAVKHRIQFWDHPHIQKQIVNNTCERCPIEDCTQRAAPATIVEDRLAQRTVREALDGLKA